MFEYEVLDNKKKISIVILTHAPNDCFVDSIRLLLKQSIKAHEIFIINTDESIFYNNLSSDNKLYLDKLINDKTIIVKHIEQADFDHGKTRNYAASLATGDYILYMTDDAVPYDDKLLYNLLIGFDDERVAISTARQVAKADAKFTEKLVREFNYKDETYIRSIDTENIYGIKNYFVSNACTMYEKKIFDALLGFKENIPLNEDMLYAYKAIHNNYKIYYNSNARVYHSHNFSYIEQFKRNFAIAKSQKQNKEVFDKLHNVSEGKKLVSYVLKSCIKERKFLSMIDFTIECVFRYLGFICGRVL